jgi:CSLREA domain-containing protein
MIARSRVALTLFAALFLLALPAVASAAVYEVNSGTDEEDAAPGVGGCLTAGLKCTLRAAIEESNASTSVNDEIVFSSAFDGKKADSTITVGFGLPTIEDEVTIDGGRCETDAGVEGPCVEVSGESRLDVRAANSQIEGLAISGSQIAIAVEAEEFEARGDWIGFHLDGTSGAGEQPYGIFVAPHADNAVIGGTAAADRNVIGNTNSGVVLRGASSGTVLGNYFGVEPDGTTPASNGRDLVVADKEELLTSVPATDDQVGADVGEAGAETSECDLGCNVLASEASGSVAAIDLEGGEFEEELPATGPTAIEGNYIGLDAGGEAFAEAAPSGIRVGSAGGVTIGGPEPGQANQIHGGTYGVFAGSGGEPALDLVVEGNRIGRSLDDSAGLFAPSNGIYASSEGITEAADTARFVDNSIEATQVGIESHSTGAVIAGNSIAGAEIGVHAWGDTEASGIGNLIEGNEIVDPVEEGILIENDFNELFGNEISGAGASGIMIQPFLSLGADENLVGGDVPGSENRIFGSGDDAISIRDFEGTFTEVARNLGAENGGRFIRLDPAGGESVGPNGGIEPPDVTAAGKTEASGSAEPLALVRVFRKASSESGELGAFLGEATADAGGSWSVTYAALPGSTLVTATQTNTEGGTSELADPVATPADPQPPSGGGNSGGNGGQGGTPDTIAPTVKITKGPKANSTSTTAKFKFKANEAGSTFQCRLDKGKFKNCRSPKTYKKLKPGKHVFKVRATDQAGNVGAAAKRKFTVLP